MAESRHTADAKILELRVHGVNNTTPYDLLDLPPDAVRLVAGDKLGSFWEPTPDAAAAIAAARPGQRGAAPPGVRREAYSWGGMVRTVPNVGGLSIGGVVAGVVARVLYAVVLPFSIGNAVMWSRSLSTPDNPSGPREKLTAGAARLFGLLLTLLFTTTAVTIAIDVVALQCGSTPARCGPLEGALEGLQGLTAGQRLALLSLVPVLAVILLAVFAAVSRTRYDVLPGMELNTEETGLPRSATDGRVGASEAGRGFSPKSVLSQPGFWVNRVTTDLSRTHIAAAILLVATFVAGQAASGPWQAFYGWTLGISAGLLGAAVVLACVVPTMTISVDPGDVERGFVERSWARVPSLLALGAAGAMLLVTLAPLAFAPEWAIGAAGRSSAELTPLVIIAVGGFLALTGAWWRKDADRRTAAWRGCAPAVFMTVALTVSVATSAIVVVTTADWLNGAQGPAALIGQQASAPAPPVDEACGCIEQLEPSIRISGIWVVLGTVIVLAVIVALLIIVPGVFRTRVDDRRARAWGAPITPDDLPAPTGGILPPSRAVLFSRILGARTRAARAHLAEPIVGVLAIVLGAALVLSLALLVWAAVAAVLTTYDPYAPAISGLSPILTNTLNVGMWVLAVSGVAIVGALAAGGTGDGARPLGTVWDIACFLPRTGHPFGPPCYAERAVPEIAGHLNHWLAREDRRAVLAAHSMGAVLSVAALGLLASSERTRPALSRVSLLTFGVQLRPFFGRMLPELLGPDVLGTQPALAPRLFARDPWLADFEAQTARHEGPATSTAPPSTMRESIAGRFARPQRPTGAVTGTLVRADHDGAPLPLPGLRWVSLWRLTDYLGYPAMSTAPGGADGSWTNDLDRIVDELDTSGYLVKVGTHGAYYRTSGYVDAITQLARKSRS